MKDEGLKRWAALAWVVLLIAMWMRVSYKWGERDAWHGCGQMIQDSRTTQSGDK